MSLTRGWATVSSVPLSGCPSRQARGVLLPSLSGKRRTKLPLLFRSCGGCRTQFIRTSQRRVSSSLGVLACCQVGATRRLGLRLSLTPSSVSAA